MIAYEIGAKTADSSITAIVDGLARRGMSVADGTLRMGQVLLIDGDVMLYDSITDHLLGRPPIWTDDGTNTGLSLTQGAARGAVLTRQAKSLPTGTTGLLISEVVGGWVAVPVDAAGAALGAGWSVVQDPADHSISVTAI